LIELIRPVLLSLCTRSAVIFSDISSDLLDSYHRMVCSDGEMQTIAGAASR